MVGSLVLKTPGKSSRWKGQDMEIDHVGTVQSSLSSKTCQTKAVVTVFCVIVFYFAFLHLFLCGLFRLESLFGDLCCSDLVSQIFFSDGGCHSFGKMSRFRA